MRLKTTVGEAAIRRAMLVVGAAIAFAVLGAVSRIYSQVAIPFRSNPLREAMGTNLNWVWDGDGLRLSDPGQPSGRTDSLVRSMGYTMVRIPGGTVARHFDWRASVGPQRGVGADYSGRPQVMSTGLAEFKRFAARYNLKVLYIVNIQDDPDKVSRLDDEWNALPPAGRLPIRYMELWNEYYL